MRARRGATVPCPARWRRPAAAAPARRRAPPARAPRASALRCAGPCRPREGTTPHATPPCCRHREPLVRRHRRQAGPAPAGLFGGHPAPPMVTTRSDRGTDSSGSWEDSSTAAPSETASVIRSPSRVRAGESSPACGSSSSHNAGRRATSAARRPAALAGGQPARRRGAQPAHQAQALRAASAAATGSPRRGWRSDVLRRTQLVVEGAACPRRPTWRRTGHMIDGQVDPSQGFARGTASSPAQARSRLVFPPRWRRPPPPPLRAGQRGRPRQGRESGRRERRQARNWTTGAMAFGTNRRRVGPGVPSGPWPAVRPRSWRPGEGFRRSEACSRPSAQAGGYDTRDAVVGGDHRGARRHNTARPRTPWCRCARLSAWPGPGWSPWIRSPSELARPSCRHVRAPPPTGTGPTRIGTSTAAGHGSCRIGAADRRVYQPRLRSPRDYHVPSAQSRMVAMGGGPRGASPVGCRGSTWPTTRPGNSLGGSNPTVTTRPWPRGQPSTSTPRFRGEPYVRRRPVSPRRPHHGCHSLPWAAAGTASDLAGSLAGAPKLRGRHSPGPGPAGTPGPNPPTIGAEGHGPVVHSALPSLSPPLSALAGVDSLSSPERWCGGRRQRGGKTSRSGPAPAAPVTSGEALVLGCRPDVDHVPCAACRLLGHAAPLYDELSAAENVRFATPRPRASRRRGRCRAGAPGPGGRLRTRRRAAVRRPAPPAARPAGGTAPRVVAAHEPHAGLDSPARTPLEI